jgi:hypothetical protein
MTDYILTLRHSDIRFDDLKLPCLAQDIGETMGLVSITDWTSPPEEGTSCLPASLILPLRQIFGYSIRRPRAACKILVKQWGYFVRIERDDID